MHKMNRKQIIIIHILFWFIIISLNVSFKIFSPQPFSSEWISTHTYKTILEFIDFYIFYSIIIPRLFIRRNYLKFSIATILYIPGYSLLYGYSMNYLEIKLGLVENFQNIYLVIAIYYTVLYIFLGGLFKLAVEGYKTQQQKILLEKQNVKSELALLRSQVNPHFLFNTLNTIHSFVNNNHQKAARAVIKLSDIMRYMLYEAAREKITLDKEIEYLNSYVTLQNFRLEKSRFVEFKLKGKTSGILIPPMLFTPFVENAFKHGKKKGKETGITIDFEVNNNMVLFEITNDIDPVKSEELIRSEGFGLKNVRRRLELLYPHKHELEIIEKDNNFTVRLQIEL